MPIKGTLRNISPKNTTAFIYLIISNIINDKVALYVKSTQLNVYW